MTVNDTLPTGFAALKNYPAEGVIYIAGIVKKILPDATIIPFTEFHRYERKRTLVTYAAPALAVSLDSSSESVTISFATAKSEEYRIVSERAIEGRLIFPGIVRDIIKLG